MRNVPYWFQGALFAPALLILAFVLKASCPAPTGTGCFADAFLPALFMPVAFVYQAFGQVPLVVAHEISFMVLYWCLVGLLVGFIFDLYKGQSRY